MSLAVVEKLIRTTVRPILSERLRKNLRSTLNHWVDDYYRIREKEVACNVHGHTILLSISSRIEKFRADTYESKEPETLRWIEENLKPGDVLFDIGANIGLYSLFAGVVQKKAKIYAFEPHLTNFQRLCRNILQNRAENLIPCNIALSSGVACEDFHISDFTAGIAFSSVGKKPVLSGCYGVEAKESLSFELMTASLDWLCKEGGLPVPNLVKLDVDGNEAAILKGCEQTLRKGLIRSLLVELNWRQGGSSDLAKYLEQFGYKGVGHGEMVVRDGECSQNFIFAYAP